MFDRHNTEGHFDNIRLEDGAKRYALKYALKPHQKKVPRSFQDVGRFWGNSRDVGRIADGIEFECTELEAREWLKTHVGFDADNWVELPKYIWKRR